MNFVSLPVVFRYITGWRTYGARRPESTTARGTGEGGDRHGWGDSENWDQSCHTSHVFCGCARSAFSSSTLSSGDVLQRMIGGVVNMSPTDHMGLDLSAFRMLEIKNGEWALAGAGS